MPTKIRCPQCNTALNVPDNLLGKTLRCPRCQSHVKTEAPPEELECEVIEEVEPAVAPEPPQPQAPAPDRPEPPRKKRKRSKKRGGLLARLGLPAIAIDPALAKILGGLV